MSDDPAAWLAALLRARASGVLSVKHGDTMTTFRSLAEIDSIIRSISADPAIVPAGTRTRSRIVYPRQNSKGL
jgi:hypothetical protein